MSICLCLCLSLWPKWHPKTCMGNLYLPAYGEGGTIFGDPLSLPPPVRYLEPAAKQLEEPLVMARTAMFCRIPLPGADTSLFSGPRPEQRLPGPDRGGQDRSGCRRGPQPTTHIFLPAVRSHKGQLLEFLSASLEPDMRWLREK